MIRKIGAAAGACALVFFSAGARAIDGVSVEVGRGDDRTSLLRVGVIDRWRQRPPVQAQWHLAGYWEISAGVWDTTEESTADIGVTPVFRLQRSLLYVEAAIGAHLVQAHISAHGTFSTAFRFGSHVGAGIHSGKYDFGVRVQHLSNGGVSSPNAGIDFWMVRLQYDLE